MGEDYGFPSVPFFFFAPSIVFLRVFCVATKTTDHFHNGILLRHKKEWNLSICDNMDESREYYAKINKSDVERQILYDFIYIWKLKKKTNEQTKQKKTHRNRTN